MTTGALNCCINCIEPAVGATVGTVLLALSLVAVGVGIGAAGLDEFKAIETGLADYVILGASTGIAVINIAVAEITVGTVIELTRAAELLKDAGIVLEHKALRARCTLCGDNLHRRSNVLYASGCVNSGGDVFSEVLIDLAGVAVVLAVHCAYTNVTVVLGFGETGSALVAVKSGSICSEVVITPAAGAAWALGGASDALLQIGVIVHSGNAL